MKHIREKLNEELSFLHIEEQTEKEMLKKILSSEEGKYIEQETKKKAEKKRKWVLPAVAAAVFAIAVIYTGVSTGAFSAGGRMIYSFFLKPTASGEQIVEDTVFSDQDEHLKMEITEAFSDGEWFALALEYTALDEKGKKLIKSWVKKQGNERPYICQYAGFFTVDLADEYKKDKEMVFGNGRVQFYENAEDYGSMRCLFVQQDRDAGEDGTFYRYSNKKVRISYEMSAIKRREAELMIPDHTEKVVYKLEPEKGEEAPYLKFILPTYLVASDYSYTIIGKNINMMTEFTENNIRYQMWTKEFEKYTQKDDVFEKPVWFYTKNELQATGETESGYGKYENDALGYDGIILANGRFFDEKEFEEKGGLNAKMLFGHVGELERIKIGEVTYRLVKVTDSKTTKQFIR